MSEHERSGPTRTGSWAGSLGRGAVRLVLTVAVVCGVVAAGLLWDAGARADRERAAHLHEVRATTTRQVAVTAVGPWSGARSQSVAAAVWEYPAGVRRSGTVEVPPQTPKGHAVRIWVDDRGVPSGSPGSTGDRVLTTFAGGLTAAAAAAASGMGVACLARRRTESRRLVAWEREWEQVEPVWSGRLRRGSGPGSGDE
ncbi:Rv1733c family protein [Streptomyces cavernicola]|uniref:Proline rich protein membrane protein n=1 Tax=Streptomyces cavernicola TaxID=3043613 RepID=A0ABT6SG86_9ACTN|nr:hypothetical protein [Streptomyces sp. B-S-A6]MDI3406864.1 hypothetical protein [Streptomyces sp. B-S-A6]